jgi:hypothetical protein
VLANFAPGLERIAPPETPEPLFDHFPSGLTTAEVALLLAYGSDPVPDRAAAERVLGELAAEGQIVRVEAGRDTVWSRARVAAR